MIHSCSVRGIRKILFLLIAHISTIALVVVLGDCCKAVFAVFLNKIPYISAVVAGYFCNFSQGLSVRTQAQSQKMFSTFLSLFFFRAASISCLFSGVIMYFAFIFITNNITTYHRKCLSFRSLLVED